LVTKEIGNNVQTVSCGYFQVVVSERLADLTPKVPIHMGSGPDSKYAVYNETRDRITTWNGKIAWQYIPKDPYPWVKKAWPNGYN
jgi:hypothetical protein